MFTIGFSFNHIFLFIGFLQLHFLVSFLSNHFCYIFPVSLLFVLSVCLFTIRYSPTHLAWFLCMLHICVYHPIVCVCVFTIRLFVFVFVSVCLPSNCLYLYLCLCVYHEPIAADLVITHISTLTTVSHSHGLNRCSGTGRATYLHPAVRPEDWQIQQ